MRKVPIYRLIFAGFLGLMLAACGGGEPTPTVTPIQPPATATPTLLPVFPENASNSGRIYITETYVPPTPYPPNYTPEPIIHPLIETDMTVPIHITLPDGWEAGHGAIQMPDGGTDLGFLPFSVYRGAVTEGNGYIVVVWGFRNITTANPFEISGANIHLVGDGLRMLTLAILDPGCNIGLDTDREFMIGEIRAAGGYFAADNCPELPDGTPGLPDAKGWFAVTQQSKINFAFYAYTEPPSALDGKALAELQAILDTVIFDMDLLPEPQPTQTPSDQGE